MNRKYPTFALVHGSHHLMFTSEAAAKAKSLGEAITLCLPVRQQPKLKAVLPTLLS